MTDTPVPTPSTDPTVKEVDAGIEAADSKANALLDTGTAHIKELLSRLATEGESAVSNMKDKLATWLASAEAHLGKK